eukprot:c18472_g1_i1 orf=326-1156(-)
MGTEDFDLFLSLQKWVLSILTYFFLCRNGLSLVRSLSLSLKSMAALGDEESLTGSRERTMSPVEMDSHIDPSAARFPRCIVWTPLPIIAWLAPFVGHVGIAHEDGVILDFAGSYFINVDNFAFGAPARYVQLSKEQCAFASHLSNQTCMLGPNQTQLSTAISWDDGLRSTMRQFQHITYNLFTCNCHSFVASCLNKLAYRGLVNWNVISVVFLIFLEGRWVSKTSIVMSFAPFLVVLCIGLYMVGWPFFTGWAIFNLLLIGWFVMGTYCLRGLIKC